MFNDQCPCQRCNGLETGAWEDEDYGYAGAGIPSEREQDAYWADYYKAQKAEDDAWLNLLKRDAMADLEDAIWTQIREETQ